MKIHLLCLSALLVVPFFLTGCFSPRTQSAPDLALRNRQVVKDEPRPPRKLLVFYDGTANKWKTRTNVRRLFEMISGQQDPGLACFYIDGVGNGPGNLLGAGLGWGMKPRVLAGHKFLSENWRPGDEIYIFGFSRGAHQARTLAGLVAHAGLLELEVARSSKQKNAAARMWQVTKDTDDVTEAAVWTAARGRPVLDHRLRDEAGLTNRYAEITFLGVWDTVPGSMLKVFGLDREMPDGKPGIRYKLRPYPPIREIAHAVSLDEKRNRFRPILAGPPVDASRTTVHELWFPGAHADVGGGYADDSDLPGFSLNWMLGLLDSHKLFRGGRPVVHADPVGVAHESICDWPANLFSSPEDRFRPADAQLHPSAQARTTLGPVLWRKRGEYYRVPYSVKPSAEEFRPFKKHWFGLVY